MNNRHETLRDAVATIIQTGHINRETSEETAEKVIAYVTQHTACPHVVQGDEGTAYCALAESTVRALQAKIATLLGPELPEKRIEPQG